MKKLFLTVFALTAIATAAMADTGIFGGYIVLSLDGGLSSFYKLENPNDNVTPPFSGVNFGLFDPSLGQSFTLNGGEADTFKNGGGNVTAAFLNYRIFLTSSTPGAFTSLSLPYDSDLGNGDQKWQTSSASTDLLSGLQSGNYTLEVYLSADTNEGAKYLNGTDGSNYTATFTIVPEPSPLALIAGPAVLGAFFFIRRRRRA